MPVHPKLVTTAVVSGSMALLAVLIVPAAQAQSREMRSPDVILAGRGTGPAPLPSPTVQSSGGLDWDMSPSARWD